MNRLESLSAGEIVAIIVMGSIFILVFVIFSFFFVELYRETKKK